MIDSSDVDSWYDWKRGDDFNEMPHGKNYNVANDRQLIGPSRFNDLSQASQMGSARSNGLIRYDALPTSSPSNTDVRFINPAIYAETLNNEDEEEHEVEVRVKVSSKDNAKITSNCGDSMEMTEMMSTLSIKNDLTTHSIVDHAGDQAGSQDTYRCYSLNSPNTSLESGIVRSKSVTSCRPSVRVERRCRIVDELNDDELCSARQVNSYAVNGHRVVRVSTASLTSISMSENRSNEGDIAKKISYGEWMRKKQQVERRKKEQEDLVVRERQMESEKLTREKEERESRERENFMKWSERKKREEGKKKAMVEKELELQKQLKEVEDKAAIAKTLYLRQWARKKKDEEKARQRKEQMKQKQIDEEKKKRVEESSKAYENWRKLAKNKPKPATQGLLPHQKAKPAYVNPTPWQTIVDDSDDADETLTTARKTQSQPKISSRKNASYQ